jgi:hypothetical protein
VDGGFGCWVGVRRAVHIAVFVEGVVESVGWWDQTDCADGEFRAGAGFPHGMPVATVGCGLRVAGDRGVCRPCEASSVVKVELVFERDALFVNKDRFADRHGVDEALRNSFGGIRGIVLHLVGGRACAVVEGQTLLEREDEVNEIRVGGNHCGEIRLGCRRGRVTG